MLRPGVAWLGLLLGLGAGGGAEASVTGPGDGAELIEYGVDFSREIADWFLFDLDGDDRRDVFVLFDEDGEACSWELALQTGARRFDRRVRGRFEGAVALALGYWFDGEDQQMAVILPSAVEFWRLGEGDALTPVGQRLEYTGFARAGLSEVPSFWHWAEDLDADGFDDLQLPGEDGVIVFFGRGEGRFDEAVLLEVPTERGAEPGAEGFVDVVSVRPRPVFRDLDGDARVDLCWFDTQGFWYRLQTAPRRFDAVRHFELSWTSGGGHGVLERTDVDLEDLNGDGRADLVMSRMSAKEGSIGAMQTTMVVLCNRGGDELFVRKPDTALVLEGVVGSGPHFADADGDGRLDLSFATYSAAGGAMGSLLGKVNNQLFLHRGTGRIDEPFSGSPDYQTRVSLDSDDFERWRSRNSAFVHEDLTGDGLAESYLLERTREGHRFHLRRGTLDSQGYTPSDRVEWSQEIDRIESMTVRTVREGEPQALVFVHEKAFRFFDLR